MSCRAIGSSAAGPGRTTPRSAMRFNKKTVVITGGAGHLGRAVAQAVGEFGAELGLPDMEEGKTGSHLFLQTGLTSAERVQSAAERIRERFGRIDVLCNIAGAFRMG